MINITHASEGTKKAKKCGIIYGQPGDGKTMSLAFIAPKKKKLIIDIDRSSDVLMQEEVHKKVDGLKKATEFVDIIQVGLDMKAWVEVVEWLEKGNAEKYDVVCVDNITELEHQMLTEYGRIGKNDGAPELLHYNRVQFKIIDYVRRFRNLPTNIVFTAWQELKDVVYPSGEKHTKIVPRLSGKSMDTVCGLCNFVAHIEKSSTSDERGFRLTGDKTVYAKDQVEGRKFCKLSELI